MSSGQKNQQAALQAMKDRLDRPYVTEVEEGDEIVTTVTTRRPKGKMSRILPGTPEMELFLGVGYDGMTAAEAQAIIAERAANPASHPYELLKKAEAFLAAYNARPRAIDTDPHWVRDA